MKLPGGDRSLSRSGVAGAVERGATAAFRVSWVLVAAACSSFSGGDDRLLGDAASIEVSVGQDRVDPWWCLAEGSAPDRNPMGSSTGGQVALRMPLHDQFTQRPPAPGLEGRFCTNTDLGCTRPVVDWMPVPADGRLTAFVPAAYTGYAEVRGSGYPNSVFVMDTPMVRDLVLYSYAMVPIEGLTAIGQVLMQPVLLPDDGLLVAAVLDCNGQAPAGVRVALSSGGDPFALVAGVPVPGRVEAAADGTIIFNQVPPGPAVVTVTTTDGRVVRELGVDVRGGWYTEVFLRPIVYSADELCSTDGSPAVPGNLDAVGRIRLCNPAQ